MPHRARHLVSPAEVVDLLTVASGGASYCSYEVLESPELQFYQLEYTSPSGVMRNPPTAFYCISEVLSSEPYCSYLAEDSDGPGEPRPVPPGATSIHQAGTGATYRWTQPHRGRMAALSPQLLGRAAEETGIAHPARLEICSSYAEPDAVCQSLLLALVEEAAAGPHVAQPLALASLASALACRLLRRHNSFSSATPREPGGLTPRQFAVVRAYLEDNLSRRVSLDELATLVGVSRFHFARSFRRTTGESPMGYLLRTRIERSKQLLARRGTTVAAVALELGFADQSHFTRTFRRLLGTSPMRFARLQAEFAPAQADGADEPHGETR